MRAKIHVTLKTGVLDPQGKAIGQALHHLGFSQVGEVRQGKLIEIEITGSDVTKARADLDAMCKALLANTVIENYAIDVES